MLELAALLIIFMFGGREVLTQQNATETAPIESAAIEEKAVEAGNEGKEASSKETVASTESSSKDSETAEDRDATSLDAEKSDNITAASLDAETSDGDTSSLESDEQDIIEIEQGDPADASDEQFIELEAPDLHFRSQSALDQHYEKHGIEMGFETEEEYEKAAAMVVANPKALHKLEAEDGDDVYYLEDTNEFVIVSTKGYIRTYFLPSAGIKYYNRQ